MASFPAAIASLTNPVAGDRTNLVDHAANHTDANNEIMAIETALGVNLANVAAEGAWTDYAATSTIVGWSSIATKYIFTKAIGSIVFVSYYIDGTSNATGITFTVPFTSSNDGMSYYGVCGNAGDNGSTLTTACRFVLPANSTTVTVNSNMGGGTWTASNQKYVGGQFWYKKA